MGWDLGFKTKQVYAYRKLRKKRAYLPMSYSFPHEIFSLAFNAFISSGLIETKLRSAISEMSFFSALVRDLISKPICLLAFEPVENSIVFASDLFLL